MIDTVSLENSVFSVDSGDLILFNLMGKAKNVQVKTISTDTLTVKNWRLLKLTSNELEKVTCDNFVIKGVSSSEGYYKLVDFD